MRGLAAATVFLLALMAGSAQADVSVTEQVLQSGRYAKAQCKPDPKAPDYDECTCDADIRYPQVMGMDNAQAQDHLNGWFKNQASQAVCEGGKVDAPAKDAKVTRAPMSVSVHYETTFSSPDLLGLKFTDWAYTGGAHGNGSVVGVIVDLKKGRLLEPNDVFSAKELPGVNQTIYDALSAKPEEEVFRDQIESRKGGFIRDNACQGCTLTLTPQGVHVLFQTYEVAPYGAGNTDVPIPARFVSDASLTKAIVAQKPQKEKPEKK